MQLLPAELKHLIVELSSESDDSLAALARTHSAFQSVAEKALYDTISIYTSCPASLECMQTLARNSKKAAFVRSLTIEYESENIENWILPISYLSRGLINMHTLSHFRVKSYGNMDETQAKTSSLSKIVWLVCELFIF